MFEAWFDTLSGIEEEFDLKAENLAQYIKCLKAEVEVIDTETKKLRERRDSRNKRIERLKIYLMNCMQAIGVKKLICQGQKLRSEIMLPDLKLMMK